MLLLLLERCFSWVDTDGLRELACLNHDLFLLPLVPAGWESAGREGGSG